MKNLIIFLVLIIVLSSCGNSSSGSDNSNNTTSPDSNSEFSKIPAGQLFKGNVCTSPGAGSIRFYFTKLSSNTAVSEYDVFEKNGCEADLTNRVSFTVKRTQSVNHETSNSVDSTFKQVSLVSTKYEAMPLTQEYADIWNTANYCNMNWVASEYRDISNCDQQTQIGSVEFLTFKFINNQILLFDGHYYE